MDEAAIIDYVGGLPGVVTFTASEENDSPATAWGDTFFFYDPEGKLAENQRLPFATVVVHDYAGWDTESRLDRDGDCWPSASPEPWPATTGRPAWSPTPPRPGNSRPPASPP